MLRRVSLFILMLLQVAVAADLTSDIDRLLATVPTGGRSAVLVFDLAKQQLLYSRNGGEAFAPASVAKVLVGAASLFELGSDYRFTTSLIAGSPVQGGALPGLGVLADGDPCLDTHFYIDPNEPLRAWAAALKPRPHLKLILAGRQRRVT